MDLGALSSALEEFYSSYNSSLLLQDGMTWLTHMSRSCRRYMYRPEVLTICTILLLSVLYYQYTHYWWKNVSRGRVAVWTALGQDPGPEEAAIASSQQKTVSWDVRKDNVCVYAIQGRRPHMEDRFNVVNNFENTGTSVYGVFDGHGGEFAADFVEKALFKSIMIRILKDELDENNTGGGDAARHHHHHHHNHTQLLTEEILNVDGQLLNVARASNVVAGTTALVATVKDNILTVANVGDSRGVICDKNGQAIPLSFDHKPQQVKERKRIKKAGGFISFNGVWRVAGVLATSRALGDFPLKERNFVIAEPDILTFNLTDLDPQFMVLATDGLWDTFSNEEAVQYIKERLDEPHYGAKSITLQSYYRGSLDNITVMVVNFRGKKDVVAKNGYKTPPPSSSKNGSVA